MKVCPPARRAFTLIELILALAIIAAVSPAIAALVKGGADATRYVNASTDSVWQIENASRRIMYNLRTASALDAPNNTGVNSSLTVHTQEDPNNSNTAYQVSYALSGTDLQETDDRYGTSTIARNVTAFTVQRLSASSPFSVQITITAGTTNPLTRSFVVFCRNL